MAQPFRLGINARILTGTYLRGWGRYTINLLSAFADLPLELFLYTDRTLNPDFIHRLPPHKIKIIESPPMPYLFWEQFWLPYRMFKDKIELFHSPINYGLPIFSPCPTVLTLHDAIDQLYYDALSPLKEKIRPAHLLYRLTHWWARLSAKKIITVSHCSKKDLAHALALPADKVEVIYEAADPFFSLPADAGVKSQIRQKYNLPQDFFLYIGGHERRKNIAYLIQAFAEVKAEVGLVLVGAKEEEKEQLQALAQKYQVMGKTFFLPVLNDQEISALYELALAFIYPSEYEGFGLQLCEAMAKATPILAAQGSCFPEILAQGGLYFDLQSSHSLSALMLKLQKDPLLKKDLSQRAATRGKDFSWAKTASQTWELYQSLSSGAKRVCK